MSETEIVISTATTSAGAGSARYHVALANGETLIDRARDPEFESARLLLSQGVVGSLVTRWAGSAVVSMRLDIEAAANLATSDPSKGSTRISKWVPYPTHEAPEHNGESS